MHARGLYSLSQYSPHFTHFAAFLQIEHSSLSCARFFTDHLQRGVPVLIRGHLHAEKWAALDYFSDLRRLYDEHGSRLVPINLGSPLVGYRGMEYWPLGKLIERSLLSSIATEDSAPSLTPDEETACEVAYMSQHHLLHQVRPDPISILSCRDLFHPGGHLVA